MDQKNSPHSTVRLKSNDKRAVFRNIRFCSHNTRSHTSHDHVMIELRLRSAMENIK
jgi:hypothetical protein